jgi:hypothetical protein
MVRNHERIARLVVERYGGPECFRENFQAALKERMLRLPEEVTRLVISAKERAIAEGQDPVEAIRRLLDVAFANALADVLGPELEGLMLAQATR